MARVGPQHIKNKTGNVSNSTLKKIIENVTVDIMAVVLKTENT
jgi:hypothetical protein